MEILGGISPKKVCHCEPVRRLVWQSPGISGQTIGAAFYLGDSHASVRTGSE